MWGTICDDGFTNKEATVICRMIGYESGEESNAYRQSDVTPSPKIWLDNVRCSGNETDIAMCSHRGWGTHNCGHGEDIAIRCYGM